MQYNGLKPYFSYLWRNQVYEVRTERDLIAYQQRKSNAKLVELKEVNAR